MLWLGSVILSDLVIFLSFPPFPAGLLMFVGLVPLLWALDSAKSWKQAFFRTWVLAFIGNTLICFWVAHTMHHFARLPWALSYPTVLVLSVFEQSAWPIWGGLRHWARERWGRMPLLWSPALLVSLDFLWPKFFPNTIGNTLYNLPWLNQSADLFGVFGLTFLLVTVNEAVWEAIRRQPGWKREVVAAAVVFVGFLGYSLFRLQQVRAIVPRETVKIAIVQPNINPVARVRESADKHAARFEMLQPLLKLSRTILGDKPDFIFWPETSISNTYHSQDENETFTVTQAIDQFQKEAGIPLLFGGRDKQQDRLYNTLYLKQDTIQRYYKAKLLWLGESIPLASFFPDLANALRKQGATSFDPGPGPMLLEVGKWKLGPMICLEGLYPEYVRATAKLGADLFVSATNDAWFGTGQEPALHLYLTAFRSIENRRPLVRSTTTGYSAVVGIDGQMIWRTELETEAAKTIEVPVYDPIFSPYLYWGTLPLWVLAFWVVFPFARRKFTGTF